MNVLKQVLGVDVAQKELVVSLGRLTENLEVEIYSYRVFKNKETGFVALSKWLSKNTLEANPVHIVMEATGVYHQKFAHFMKDNGYRVNIVLPNKISNYIRTLENKTITDKTCSEAIARFGLERQLKEWNKPDPIYHVLQQLTRERDQIVSERTVFKNRLHAENSEVAPNKGTLKRIKAMIKFLDKQEQDIKREINKVLEQNKGIKEDVRLICTIPGMGALTAVTILSETNGFELINSKKQLTSYAGMDIKEKQSGTSVKGKPRMSKKGNRYLRKSLHLPALSAVKHNTVHRELYDRLVSKHGIKMKALTAVQRKLLELAYVLWKTRTKYNPEYEKEKRATQMADSLAN